MPKWPEPPQQISQIGNEIWRDIPGFNGYYQASTFGRVKSLHKGKEHIMKQQLLGNYYMTNLYVDGKKFFSSVHRLIAKTFLPNSNDLPEVDHIDGDTTNNHISNLE